MIQREFVQFSPLSIASLNSKVVLIKLKQSLSGGDDDDEPGGDGQ